MCISRQATQLQSLTWSEGGSVAGEGETDHRQHLVNFVMQIENEQKCIFRATFAVNKSFAFKCKIN